MPHFCPTPLCTVPAVCVHRLSVLLVRGGHGCAVRVLRCAERRARVFWGGRSAAPLRGVLLLVLALVGFGILTGCAPKQLSAEKQAYGRVASSVSPSREGTVYLPADDGKPLSPEEMDALISVGDFDRNVSGEDMRDVMLHFKYYVHQARRTVSRNVERGQLYLPHIRTVLRTKRLPLELAYLPFIESGYDPLAKSPTGALGMWQFVKGSGTYYGMKRDWWMDERHDPYQSTDAATLYLAKLNDMFDDWHLAISAYNAGEGRISRAMKASGARNFFQLRKLNERVPDKDQLTEENKQYLPRFLAVCKIMRNLGPLGFTSPDSTKALQVKELSVRPSTDLMALSRTVGMSWDEFSQFNPAYLRYISPPDRSTKVYVPTAQAREAQNFVSKPPARTAGTGWEKYTVRRGDTMSRIASRSGVPLKELRRVNQVSEPLKLGYAIMIPRSTSGAAIAGKEDPAPAPTPAPTPAKTASAAPPPQGKITAATASAKKTAPRTYTVRGGDTVYALSRQWDVSPQEILEANSLSARAQLRIGQVLVKPGEEAAVAAPAARKGTPRATTYIVQPGDTVWAIARKFDVSPTELLRANNLGKNAQIKPGDAMKVGTK